MSASSIREFVIERLLHEATSAFTDGTRVRALELLGKVAEVGMFVNRTETTNITAPPGELQATLLAKLRLFFDTAQSHAQPLATLTDKRQGHTIEQGAEDVVDLTATVRQSPINATTHDDAVHSIEGDKGVDAEALPLVPPAA